MRNTGNYYSRHFLSLTYKIFAIYNDYTLLLFDNYLVFFTRNVSIL